MSPLALVMAGGTGGHIFPALAVARGLEARGWKVVWLGTPTGLEARLVPQAGMAMEWLRVTGLRGKGGLAILQGLIRLVGGLWGAVGAMRRRRPDVVIGFGGFVAFPGGVAAVLTGRPLLIHEQNAIAGLSNRLLALLARQVMTGFPDAFQHRGRHPLAKLLPVPRSATWTGNPVRQDLLNLPEPPLRFAGRGGPLRVLVIGGSQGARILNSVVPRAVGLLPIRHRPLIQHQAGEKLMAEMRGAYQAQGVDAEVLPFIEDMAEALASADLVICRAGALTIAELAAVGVGSVLVPFPAAVDDHQTMNARFLSEAGAGFLVPQNELTAQGLASLLQGLDRERLLQMANLARRFARPHAADEVIHAVLSHALEETR